MASNYPTSLDTTTQLPDIGVSDEMDDVGVYHDELHTNAHQALIALETKLGTGAAPATGATNGYVLTADGAGGSSWAAQSLAGSYYTQAQVDTLLTGYLALTAGTSYALTGDLVPDSTSTRSLGSTTRRWNVVWATSLDITDIYADAAFLKDIQVQSIALDTSDGDTYIELRDHVYPDATAAVNLGTNTLAWATVYTRGLAADVGQNIGVSDSVIPTGLSYDLGSATFPWANVYADNLRAVTLYENGTDISSIYLPIASPAFTGTLTGPDITITGASTAATLSLSGQAVIGGNLSWVGHTAYLNASGTQVTVGGHPVPASGSTYDLGLSGTPWRNLYADRLQGGFSQGYLSIADDVKPSNTWDLGDTTDYWGQVAASTVYAGTLTELVSLAGITVTSPLSTRDILPDTDSSRDLGSATFAWAEIHADTIYEGGTSLASKYAPVGPYLALTGGTLTGTLTARDIIPTTDSLYDLGSTGTRWAEIWGDALTIGGTATLSTVAVSTDLTFGGNSLGRGELDWVKDTVSADTSVTTEDVVKTGNTVTATTGRRVEIDWGVHARAAGGSIHAESGTFRVRVSNDNYVSDSRVVAQFTYPMPLIYSYFGATCHYDFESADVTAGSVKFRITLERHASGSGVNDLQWITGAAFPLTLHVEDVA